MSMRGDSNVITNPVFEKQDFQQQLNNLRVSEGYDFAGVALYEHHMTSAPIKWHYVSGNLNDRYKMIILRKGRGHGYEDWKTHDHCRRSGKLITRR